MSDARKSPATERNKDVEASGSLLAIEEPFTNKQHIAASNHSTSIPDAVAVGNKLGSTPPESRSSSSVPEALVTLSSNSNVLRVESEPVAVAMAVKYGDNSMSSDDNERKYKYNVKALTCILVVIMVAIAIFLVVFFTFEKKQTKDSLTGDSENITTTSEENNLSAFEYSERRSSLIDILEPIVSDPQVFDPESSQASPDRIDALQWLVTTNLARLSIPVLEQRTSNTNSDLSLEDFPEKTTETAVKKLRQHFVLALFFFATNGSNWENQYLFLSDIDACFWNTFRSTATEVKDFFIPDGIDARGVICDTEGRVSRITMYWNNLSGTLPSELSYFKESLVELNIGGGSISGSFPLFFDDFEKLDALNLNDHCLTGTVSEALSRIPTLSILSTYGNIGLKGSFNGFCNGTSYKNERIAFLTADYCGKFSGLNSSGVECDCCLCCDPNNFECFHPGWGTSSPIYGQVGNYTYVKTFEKNCLTSDQKEWIDEKCPCFTTTMLDGYEDFECLNCTADGARKSHPPF